MLRTKGTAVWRHHDGRCHLSVQAFDYTYDVVTTGSLDSVYTTTMTINAMSGDKINTVTTTGRWLGPCAVDQKPGDVITGDGVRRNLIDEMRKRDAPPR
jgi:hypothetical protein